VRPRDWALLLVGCALGSGAVAWIAVQKRASSKPPAITRHDPDPEPEEPRSHRVAIAPLVAEKPAPPAATVDSRWADLNRKAIDLLEKGDAEKAVELFEQCRAAVPEEKIFAGNLAEALARLSLVEYDRGGEKDRQLALQHLARAAELAPSRADIQRRLEQLQRLAKSEKGMWTESSEHFELSYDGERADLIWSSYEITQVLESAYQEFGDLFGRHPVESGRPKIRVVVYRKEGFHEATGIGHWAGGLYDGTIRVPLENLRGEKAELERVLRHEIAHAFVAECGGKSVPGWLNEGLAQWLESGTIAMQAREVEAARKRLKGKELIPLDRLRRNLSELKDATEINLAYSEALALTAFLEHS
jgi:tetratricopeptide (TPR) repeat protein